MKKKLFGASVLIVMLFMALYAQLPHAQDVFFKILPSKDGDAERQAWYYAVTVECMIAVFVLFNRPRLSNLFAVVSIATNVAFYKLGGTDMFSFTQTPNLWVYWMASAILPVSIASLTHLLGDLLYGVHQVVLPLPEINLSKWFDKWLPDNLSIRVGFLVDLFRHLQDDNLPQVHVVEPSNADKPAELVPVVVDKPVQAAAPECYLPVMQALMNEQEGLRAGQIASKTGLAQSTLYRKNGDKEVGYLPKMLALGLISLVTKQEGGKEVVYYRKVTQDG